MARLSVTLSYQADGRSYTQTGLIEADQVIERKKEEFPVALDAVLQARVDNDTGTLRFTTNPGIIVGDKLDIYWNGGMRRTMKASSISGSGPYDVVVGTGGGDVGAGDFFPVVTTVLTVGKVQSFDFNFNGSNVKALLASCASKGCIVVCSGTETEEWSAVFEVGAGVQAYYEGDGTINPVTGDTITKVLMSHGDSGSIREVKVCAMTS